MLSFWIRLVSTETMMASRCRANALASLAARSVHGLPREQIRARRLSSITGESPNGKKKDECSSVCAGVLSCSLVQRRKRVAGFCVLAAAAAAAASIVGMEVGMAGRLSRAYPWVQQDILSAVLPLCVLRGWGAGSFSAELHTHCALYGETEAVQTDLPTGGSFCAGTPRHARTRTQQHGDSPPYVTATPKPHWLPDAAF